MSGCRVGILPDDQDPHLVEGKGEGAQHVRTRRQVPAPGLYLGPQELSHLGDVVCDRLQRRRPARLDEFTQRARGHPKPFTSSTTVSAPARRSSEIC